MIILATMRNAILYHARDMVCIKSSSDLSYRLKSPRSSNSFPLAPLGYKNDSKPISALQASLSIRQ